MPSIPSTPPAAVPPDRVAQLRKVAVELEASFLAEMLGQAGLGETREAFGGGAGEEGFASFLRQEQARAMARQGGIGLAEHIFESLKARTHG
ncbi:rod-binding protein [Vannielia litorea]|uniref:Rod binding protein n=1 Tax=Vannielia litorea TaxID=1217970 RepID=A0A1N6H041_9RHOB|nr:rod-binding protein [Vannielia litorea]SIO13188.1 Rod binding protein [Vannielia litorea]